MVIAPRLMRIILVWNVVVVLAFFSWGGSAFGSPFPTGQNTGTVLYSQLGGGDSGEGIVSERFFGQYAKYLSLAADDFVVPGGETWRVASVAVRGRFRVSGPHQARVVVTFYATAGDNPGAVLARVGKNMPHGPRYRLNFPHRAVTLSAGTYWISVQVISPDATTESPFWTWSSRSSQAGVGAVWRNPPNGFGRDCQTWEPITQCTSGPLGPDFRFALKGSAS